LPGRMASASFLLVFMFQLLTQELKSFGRLIVVNQCDERGWMVIAKLWIYVLMMDFVVGMPLATTFNRQPRNPILLCCADERHNRVDQVRDSQASSSGSFSSVLTGAVGFVGGALLATFAGRHSS
jgi:hypothetical protein